MHEAHLLGDCARVIEASVKRRDTEHPVFHGCYDWHSAVHGHFALLRIDRTTHRFSAAAAWADHALMGAGLAAERAQLAATPHFEMPYGRAWLLRLAIEHAHWRDARNTRRGDRLQPFAAEIAASLRAWMDARRFDPSTDAYENHAWAAAQLHAWYVHRADEDGRAFVSNWIGALPTGGTDDDDATRAEPLPTWAEDAGRPTFFSRLGQWLCAVLEARPDAEGRALWERTLPSDTDLRPIEVGVDAVHALGMNWSRAFALARLGRCSPDARLSERASQAFAAHVEAGRLAHARHVGRYHAYDHWVPQFAVYALTEGA